MAHSVHVKYRFIGYYAFKLKQKKIDNNKSRIQDFNLNLITLGNVQTFSTKIIIRIGYPINPTYYYDPIFTF